MPDKNLSLEKVESGLGWIAGVIKVSVVLLKIGRKLINTLFKLRFGNYSPLVRDHFRSQSYLALLTGRVLAQGKGDIWRPGARFSKVPKKFSHPESRSKIIYMGKPEIPVGKSNGCAISFGKLQKIWAVICIY